MSLKRRQVNLITSFSAVSSTWIVDDLPYTQCGTDIGNRIGRAVQLKQFTIRGMVTGGQSNLVTDDAYNAFRIVVFIGSVGLTFADWAARTINDPVFPGVDGVRRVLWDTIINLQVPALNSVGYITATKQINRTFDLGNELVLYDDSAVSYPSGSSSLYLAMVSDSAAATHPGFTSGYYVLFWRDLQ
jgi:hypothetical protein